MRAQKRDNRGFILALTLWVVAAAGFAAAILSEWVSTAVNNAQILQNRVESERAFLNIRNELVFALARRPYSYRGLQVGEFETPTIGTTFEDLMNQDVTTDRMIFLDGRPYSVSSNNRYVVKIQDGRGLININTINTEFVNTFLDSLSVDPDLFDMLRDTLLDYRDEDDLTRLSGAERDDYIRRQLYPPADYHLLTPWEARRILGWVNLNELWSKQYVSPVITTCRSSGFNPNTATVNSLVTYIRGVSVERAQSILEFRENAYFRNSRELGNAAGVLLTNQPFFFSFTPGRCLIVDLIDGETSNHIRFSLTLLPRNQDQPWQIDYVVRIPADYSRSIIEIDTDNTFPSPEEIDRGTGDSEVLTGL